MCVREKMRVWEEKEVCTEASLPCNINHAKSTYT